MMRNSLLSLGLVAGAGLLWAATHGVGVDALRDLASGAEPNPPTVTVVLVSDPHAVAAVRRAIEADRVVAESPQGFAVREGRIVAASADGVGELIGAAGWTDARIEIVQAGASQASRRSAPATGGDAAELRGLAGKAQLTAAEASRALQLLE